MKWIQTNELLVVACGVQLVKSNVGNVLPRVKKPGLLVSIPQPLEVTRRVRFCIPSWHPSLDGSLPITLSA